MKCRLNTCLDADGQIDEVIKALEKKEYVFWGHNKACDCDFLFTHTKGHTTISGILKVRGIKERREIPREEFSSHRPEGWDQEMDYEKYFMIEKAVKTDIPRTELRNKSDGELEAMNDMTIVTSDEFEPF